MLIMKEQTRKKKLQISKKGLIQNCRFIKSSWGIDYILVIWFRSQASKLKITVVMALLWCTLTSEKTIPGYPQWRYCHQKE